MFRITDIINIAVQIEKNGEQSYRQASEHVTEPEVREMLLWMADEEKKHRKWFESFEDNTEIAPEHEELEAMGRSLLQDMIASETFSLDQDRLNNTDTLSELFSQSKAFEEDTILFYQFLKGLIDDPEASTRMDLIIAEEKKHSERLDNLAKTYCQPAPCAENTSNCD
jgi:rubrerythrin